MLSVAKLNTSQNSLVVQTCCYLKLVSSIFKAPDPIYASSAELEPDQEFEPSNTPSSKTLLLYFISSVSFTNPRFFHCAFTLF